MSKELEHENEIADGSRSNFFKLGLGAAAIAGVGATAVQASNKVEGVSHKNFLSLLILMYSSLCHRKTRFGP